MERPLIGVGVIVLKEDRVLLGKRKNAHGEGSWSFPGGHLEGLESFEQCALREVKEETGLKIKLIDKKPITLTEDFFYREDKHYITHYLRANYQEGIAKIKEPDKCEEWNWFNWDKLPSPLFLPIQNLVKQKYNPFD